MHVAILGLAGAAAVLSVFAVTQDGGGGTGGAAVFQPQPAAAVAAVEDVRVSVEFEAASLKDVLELLAQKAGQPSQVLWPQLEAVDVQPDLSVRVRAKDATIPVVLSLVNRSIGKQGGAQLELGEVAGILSIGPREFFDRLDTVLVSYDLSGPIAARGAKYGEEREKVVEDVVGVITSFVSPDDWLQNGGDLAKLNVVGDRMFVQAPQRMHPQIKWIIGQLPANAAAPDQGAPEAAADGGKLYRCALKHSSASEVAAALRQTFPGWKIEVDARSNSLVISGPGQARTPMDAIRELDVPAKDRTAAAAPAEPAQVVYITGLVPRPGAFAVPDKDFSVRRLLAASGGLPESATEVVVTRSRSGQAQELHRLSRAKLLEPAGEDPVLAAGDQVTVR